MEKRTIIRLLTEEHRKQENIDAIIDGTIPLLTNASKPEEIDNDWLNEFLDSAKKISDDDMRSLWSKILAGEAQRAGAFSKRTLQFVSTLSKDEADLFVKLCRFYCDNVRQVFIINLEDDIYKSNGITFDSIHHLESIGLISFSALSNYVIRTVQKQVTVNYGNTRFTLIAKLETSETAVEIGHVLLNRIEQN